MGVMKVRTEMTNFNPHHCRITDEAYAIFPQSAPS